MGVGDFGGGGADSADHARVGVSDSGAGDSGGAVPLGQALLAWAKEKRNGYFSPVASIVSKYGASCLAVDDGGLHVAETRPLQVLLDFQFGEARATDRRTSRGPPRNGGGSDRESRCGRRASGSATPRRWPAPGGRRGAAPGCRNARSTVPLRIGTSSRSPSRYSRFAMPCLRASSAPNSTIFSELSMAITCLARCAISCADGALARAQVGDDHRRHQLQQRLGDALPGPARDVLPSELARPARRSSGASCPGACAGRARRASRSCVGFRDFARRPARSSSISSGGRRRAGRRLFFPVRRSSTSPACFSCARCVEIWLWPLDRISCSSATDSSSCSSSSRMRRRLGSAASRSDLRIDAIGEISLISIYQDLLIRGN